jgi:heme-degrading monooxygenase HmoA
MFLIRDIMYCKPGQVRQMVQKFQALNKLGSQMGFSAMRVMTDVSAERYWTVVSETEVKSLEEFTEMTRKAMENKAFQDAMKGYHDHVTEGRREIYMLET